MTTHNQRKAWLLVAATLIAGCGSVAEVTTRHRTLAKILVGSSDADSSDAALLPIAPSKASIYVGDEFVFKASYPPHIKPSDDPVSWSVDGGGRGSVIEKSADEVRIRADAPGTVVIVGTTKFAAGRATLEILPGSRDCQAKIAFGTKIEPLLKSRCASCHDSGGAGSRQYLIKSGPSSAELSAQNYASSRPEISLENPEKSPILLKPAGQLNHVAVLKDATDQEALTAIKDWIDGEKQCQAQVVTKIELKATKTRIGLNNSGVVIATATFSDGTVLSTPERFQWSSSDPSVAAVDAKGRVSGVKLGKAEITASIGGVTAKLTVEIVVREDSALACNSFVDFQTKVVPLLTQANCTSCHGDQGSASAYLNINLPVSSCQDKADNWRAAFAEIDVTAPANSNIVRKPTGKIAHGGGAILAPSDGDVIANWAATHSLCTADGSVPKDPCVDKKVATISLDPSALTLRLGEDFQLSAMVIYSDGTSLDLSAQTTWASDNDKIASVNKAGKVTAIGPGSAVVTASYGGISSDIAIQVISATLTAIKATPVSVAFAVGETADVTVKGAYSDHPNTFFTLSSAQLIGESTAPGIASFENGVITGRGVGKATISVHPKAQPSLTVVIAVDVAKAYFKWIEITPANATISVGQTVTFRATGVMSDGQRIGEPPNLVWSVSDKFVGDIDQSAKFTSKGSGFVNIIAKSGSASGSIGLVVESAGSCSTSDVFANKVQPIIDSSCVGCHGPRGVANGFMSLQPAAADNSLTQNKDALRSRLKPEAVEGSVLLAKVKDKAPGSGASGYHAGGAVLPDGSAKYLDMADWAKAESQCLLSDAGSSMGRISPEAMFVVLKQLFPKADAGRINSQWFDTLESAGSARIFASEDLPYSVVAQISLRRTVVNLCTYYVGASGSPELFALAPERLLPGEVMPTDPAKALVFSAARNFWLYPYGPDDQPVNELLSLYLGVKSDLLNEKKTPDVAETNARRMLCIAATSAPQFWFGNPGDADQIRRLALEVGRKIPDFADYVKYENASDKEAFLKSYTATLQVTGSGLSPGYLAATSTWHKIQYGLRAFSGSGGVRAGNSIGYATATGLGGTTFGIDETKGYIFPARSEGTGQQCALDSNGDPVMQAFDPRTSAVVWEQLNPFNSTWETLTRLDLVNGTWVETPGQITIADNQTKTIHAADIQLGLNMVNIEGVCIGCVYRYTKGALVGTPMETFKKLERRVHRYGADGREQNGWSTVKLWYTGQEVKVCNAYSRFLAACAWRPDSYPKFDGLNPTAEVAGKGYSDYPDQTLSKNHLNAFRCGQIDRDMAMRDGQPGYNEDQAYPFAYSSMAQVINQNDLNVIAYNLNDFGYEFSRGTRGPEQRESVSGIFADVKQEPYLLLKYILEGNDDYRAWVTAPYTFVPPRTELLYRTQGMRLPYYLPGWTPPASPVERSTPAKLMQSDILPLNWKTLQPRWATAPSTDITWLSSDLVMQPKPMSGVLTMDALHGPLASSGGKMRSFASRIYQRFLCGLPSDFTPLLTDDQKTLHRKFVPTSEEGGVAHLDETRGCFACHVTMDPLAAALHPGFLKSPRSKSFGDMQSFFNATGSYYGIRGGGQRGSGALLGQPVEGIEDVGQVLAKSNEFATCTVKRTFQHIFGRQPLPGDLGLISNVTAKFKTNYDYNQMVRELIASPIYRRSN